MERFYPGSVAKVYARFRDPETRLPSPVQEPVTIQVKPPGEEAVRNGTPVVMEEEGVYFARFLCDVVGTWAVYGASSGDTAAVDEGSFEVRPSAFGEG